MKLIHVEGGMRCRAVWEELWTVLEECRDRGSNDNVESNIWGPGLRPFLMTDLAPWSD